MLWLLEGIVWILRFFIGASVFSFFNVVICRLPKGESVVKGRSHCPGCGRLLTAWEMIPCISYFALRGRCRGCKEKIKARYVWMEALGGIFFLACILRFGPGPLGLISLPGLAAFLYLGILVMAAWIDWDTRIIYDRFSVGIVLLGIFSLKLFSEHTLPQRLLGCVLVAIPMLLLSLVIEGAFGGGDMKLMASSGFLLGAKGVAVAMFIGLMAGGIYCGIMLKRGKLTRKDAFAFGPFLAVGLGIAFFWGDALADWYLSLL